MKILTNEIHAAEELENIKEPQFSDVDIGDFSIETSLAGLGTLGPVVSDDVGLSVTVKIPIRFTLAVSSPWGDLFSGDPDWITFLADRGHQFCVPLSFLQPMVLMVDEVSSIFATSLVSSEGVTFHLLKRKLYFQTGSWDTTIHEDTEFDLTGPVSSLPKGIVVKEGTSQQGNMEITEDGDGRQVITYTIPPDGLDDEVTLRLQVTWMYLLGNLGLSCGCGDSSDSFDSTTSEKEEEKTSSTRGETFSVQSPKDGIVRIGFRSNGKV